MGTWVFDGKEDFDGTMSNMPNITHVEYNGKKIAFSGFEIWGEEFGEYPIFVNLDNKTREANVFYCLGGGKLQLAFWRYILKKLEKVGYTIRHLRTEVENGFIFN